MAMTVRFTEKQDAQLAQLSELMGVSKQQAVINAIGESLSQRFHRQKLDEGIADLLDEYGDLLDRLGK